MPNGHITWFNKRGPLFGYIAAECGKEIYFDASSVSSDCIRADFYVGAEVSFETENLDSGDIACNIRFLKKYSKGHPKVNYTIESLLTSGDRINSGNPQ